MIETWEATAVLNISVKDFSIHQSRVPEKRASNLGPESQGAGEQWEMQIGWSAPADNCRHAFAIFSVVMGQIVASMMLIARLT
jgi:hypothetical protein